MTPDEAVGKEVWVGLGARQWKVDNYRIFIVKSVRDTSYKRTKFRTVYLEPSFSYCKRVDESVLYSVPLEDIKCILDVDTGLTMDELHGLYWDLDYANEISEE